MNVFTQLFKLTSEAITRKTPLYKREVKNMLDEKIKDLESTLKLISKPVYYVDGSLDDIEFMIISKQTKNKIYVKYDFVNEAYFISYIYKNEITRANTLSDLLFKITILEFNYLIDNNKILFKQKL